MVDTIRDRSTLLTLLADNTTGQVSPQDLRDVLVSLDVMGSMSFELVPSGLNGIGMTGAQAILLPWDAGGLSAGIAMDNAQGTMVVGTAGTYRVSFSVSAEILSATAPAFLVFALCKNGIVPATNIGATLIGIPEATPVSPATDRRIHSGSFDVLVSCAAGDSLAICHTASVDSLVGIRAGNFTVERVL